MLLRPATLALCCALCLMPSMASAERDTTREAMERLEELLELRQEAGRLDHGEILPLILVAAAPRYEASQGWFETRALAALLRAFGDGGVRVCEACMRIRTTVGEGYLLQSSGPTALDEIAAFDERYRGQSAPARSAVWIEETQSGVALRIVDLRNGRVIFAGNIEPDLRSYSGTQRTYRLAEELERRARGESLTHAMFDLALYPGQHISLEWADQWGDTNSNLTGFVISLYDPVLGVGASYHRVLPWLHMTVGGQLLLSVPTAVAQGIADADVDILDPVLTVTGMLRVPIGSSNFAGLLALSTNGEIGLGITLLNSTILPVLP